MEILTRRNFIGTSLAGTAAVAAATLPSMATPAPSDAKLLQLCRNWHRLERALNRLGERLDDAEEAYSALPIIPKQAILLEGFEVFPGYGHGSGVCEPDLKSLFDWGGARSDKIPYLHRSDLECVALGRYWLEARLLPGGAPGDETLMPIPQPARDHARACLAALDEWEAADKAQHAEVDAWEAKQGRIQDLQAEVSEATAELPANTMEGLNAKLAIVRAEPSYAQETGIAQSALDFHCSSNRA